MTVGLANPKHTALASRVPCQGVAVKRRKRSSQINNSKFGVVRTSLSIRGMARKRFKKKKKKSFVAFIFTVDPLLIHWFFGKQNN